MPTSRDLQRDLDVSHGTMIKVLDQAANNQLLQRQPRRPSVVAAGAATRARQLLRQKGRSSGGKKKIAILVPENLWPMKSAPFWSDLLEEIRRVALSRDWQMEFVRWPVIDQVRFSHDLVGDDFDAAFATSADQSYLVSLHILHRLRFPVLLWNRRFSQVPLPSILLDDPGGTRTLANLLHQSGHRNMSLLLYVSDRVFQPGQERHSTWRAYLEENQLLDDCIAPVIHISQNSDLKAVAGLLKSSEAPTGLVFGHGAMCEAFLGCGLFNHLRIPQDISIATFDWIRNIPEVNWCPPVMHVQANLTRGAECVIEMFERMFKGKLIPPNIRMPMDLHVGESVGPPKKG